MTLVAGAAASGACGGGSHGVDAGSPGDAGDGAAPRDTGDDAPPPTDAGDGGPAPTDAGEDGGPVACSVAGRPGTCIDVAECTGDFAPTPGLCPGPTEIQCCTALPAPTDGGAGACDPEATPLPNTDLTEAPGDAGCPPGMARVDAFCVDRYEATLALVADDGTLSPASPYVNPGDARVRALSVAGAVPQGYITGVQAGRACAEAGKRLCTDAEWLRACQGVPATVYPYNDDPAADPRMPGVCNDARAAHPAIEYFGTSADWIWSMLGHRCINQLPDSVALTGDHDGCVTAEGVYDMMGNLHEWTADPAGTFRGGFYVDTVINGNGCLYRTTAHDMGHWDYSTGFRCCADATP